MLRGTPGENTRKSDGNARGSLRKYRGNLTEIIRGTPGKYIGNPKEMVGGPPGNIQEILRKF